MAAASFSIQRGSAENLLVAGSQAVTEGSSAPGAGDLEIRIDLAAGFTKNELELYFDTIWRFLSDVNESTSIPL